MNRFVAQDVPSKLAQYLLEIGAVKLSPDAPFTWASGWKSPIYCDNRLVLSYPEARNFIADALVKLINTQFPMCEAIAGVATAGIPWASLVADRMNLPLLYIRSAPKSHGLTNLIEGKISPEQQVVVLEDLISTGGSSLKAAQAVIEAGMEVLGMAAVFTYGFSISEEQFKEAGIRLHTLGDYNTLLNFALETGKLSAHYTETLQNWRENPSEWGKQ